VILLRLLVKWGKRLKLLMKWVMLLRVYIRGIKMELLSTRERNHLDWVKQSLIPRHKERIPS
jgi:hypothetical protein